MMDLTRRQILIGGATTLALSLLPVPPARADALDLSWSVASVVLDLSANHYFDMTLDHDASFLFLVNASPGQTVSIAVRQDAAGGRVFDWQDEIAWDHSYRAPPSRHANAIDVYWLATPDGETWFGWVAADIVRTKEQ